MEEKKWACQWHGVRGGKWWTGWVTEEEARKTFEEFGEKGKAQLIEDRNGLFHHIIENNKTSKLILHETSLKDALKRQKELEKSIAVNREIIKDLKKEIKAINGKINRK